MNYLDPGLVVQVRDIELLAGGVRQHLVMLLQNLVEALHSSSLSAPQNPADFHRAPARARQLPLTR